jgi:hypothetical protein
VIKARLPGKRRLSSESAAVMHQACGNLACKRMRYSVNPAGSAPYLRVSREFAREFE